MKATPIHLIVALLLTGCARGTTPTPSSSADAAQQTTGPQIVPQLVVGLAFPGIDTAPQEEMSLAAALDLREEIEDEARSHPRDEGTRGWFFHGFDDRTLYFFVGRFHVRCEILGCQDYVVERIIEVRRSADAMRKFGVENVVLFYEVGVHGVRGGMTPEEVKQVLGPPSSTVAEQYVGSFRWLYDDGTAVLFWNNVAAGIEVR
ncbi:MAG: hypothetical protein M0R80_30530 [Proteobacteria bacterium]|nr:hypothetical protein [Pseudomonadota bacterium]